MPLPKAHIHRMHACLLYHLLSVLPHKRITLHLLWPLGFLHFHRLTCISWENSLTAREHNSKDPGFLQNPHKPSWLIVHRLRFTGDSNTSVVEPTTNRIAPVDIESRSPLEMHFWPLPTLSMPPALFSVTNSTTHSHLPFRPWVLNRCFTGRRPMPFLPVCTAFRISFHFAGAMLPPWHPQPSTCASYQPGASFERWMHLQTLSSWPNTLFPPDSILGTPSQFLQQTFIIGCIRSKLVTATSYTSICHNTCGSSTNWQHHNFAFPGINALPTRLSDPLVCSWILTHGVCH